MQETDASHSSQPTFAEALKVWAKIGLLSFGGPAGQIALMHRILVDEQKWIDERRFLNALNFCTLLPGPEATQLATYVGWRLHGTAGGLAAGLLFVLPGAAMMLAISMAYAAFGNLPVSVALLTGVKAAVLAIVVEALLRIARRALKGSVDWLLATAAFLAIYLFGVPFPVIVLAAGMIGFIRGIVGGESLPALSSAAPVTVTPGETLRTAALWLAIWIGPLLAISALFGSGHVLAHIGWFFSKLAVVTFGGAYAVLAYMREAVPDDYGWLTKLEMVDALGLAETTPGPLILVTQFVGFLGAMRQGGGDPWVMGVLGAITTTWATFAPCFLWIFVGAPYVERLNAEPRLKAALAAVTAAVVGVILNLTVTFAVDVLSPTSVERWWGLLRIYLPDPTRIDPIAAVLTVVALVLTFRLHRSIFEVLGICGGLALLWRWLL
ncbi:MAG TPA: chromate efflux transporter [Hyphomicrobiaceae bacterium]|nr:chromate efflux transporter [Hyphomicrobiaceae bacterium]